MTLLGSYPIFEENSSLQRGIAEADSEHIYLKARRGTALSIHKLNLTGTTIWSHEFPENAQYLSFLTNAPNGDVAVSLTYFGTDGVSEDESAVLRFNSDGELVQSFTIDEPSTLAGALDFVDNDTLVLAGHPLYSTAGWILRYKGSTLSSSSQWDSSIFRQSISGQQSYIISSKLSNQYIGMADATGNPLWERALCSDSCTWSLATHTPSGDALVSWATRPDPDSTNTRTNHILRYDREGVLVNEREFSCGENYLMNDVSLIDGIGYIFGECQDDDQESGSYIFLAHLDMEDQDSEPTWVPAWSGPGLSPSAEGGLEMRDGRVALVATSHDDGRHWLLIYGPQP